MDMETTQSMVLEVLHQASSQNPDVLKPAEAKLHEWETQPGFYSVLYNVLSNYTIDVNVRWQAVIYIKNGIERYWRKNLPNAISEQEKEAIKQGLISNFHEPVNQIALQLAVLIAKIARIDCPRNWPELFPSLLQGVESSDVLLQHRSLLTLHHVVKACSSIRLPGDRGSFQDLTGKIYAFILNLWNNFTEAFLGDIMRDASADVITPNVEKALLCLRILKNFTVYGVYKPHTNQDCMCFLKVIFDRARASLEIRKQLKGKGIYLLELCEKFIINLTKILLSVLDIHPFSYVDFIQPTLEFTVFYLFTPAGVNLTYERFVIQCFNLIKGIMSCAEYKPPKMLEMTKEPEMLRAHQIKQAFFQADTLTEICKKIVSHYFILTQDDLDMWDTDPETFANDDVGDSWKYSLRPCTERVFVTLFHEYRDILAPVLLEMIRETNCIVPPDDLRGILQKDAVYNAVCLAAYDMYDEIDFDQWFTTTLTQELKIKHNNYRVIRRRVSKLVGVWTGIKFSSELRPALYDCIICLLGSDEDMAVRLTASSLLRHAIDDFGFNSEQFRPYVDSIFNLLFVLLKEAKECETKMHVLNVMTLMVESVGQTIRPHTDALVHYLPLLWQESEEYNMLRCAIVSTLVQLVKALGMVSPELNSFLMPIIQLGTDVNQSAIVYLLEDCLELWLTVLENSTSMSNDLLQLFNNMPPLLEYSSENLRCCLIVIIAYVLLAPELVMRTYGVQIISICDNLMADMRMEGIAMLVRLVETFIRASPSLGCETVKCILPRIFRKIYEGDDLPLMLSSYLSIMARVLLSSHEVFTQILNRLAQMNNMTEQAVLSTILDVWISKMCNVSQQEQRKLLALAFCNILTTQSNPVVQRFNGIIVNILETLNDVTKLDDDGTMTDMFNMLALTEGQSPNRFDDDNYYETDHDQRKKQLALSDPVHNIVLKDYLQSQIFELKNQLGLTHYELLWQTVDADTIEQLKGYITF